MEEPIHVHVKKGDGDGKVWLEPEIKPAYLIDFNQQEEKQILDIVRENKDLIIKKWNDYFNNKWDFDPIDKMIFEDGITITSVFFHKELDVMLILLSNRRIIERKISITKTLAHATEKQLQNFRISRTGIHWPELDEDLSLRGFLKEEMIKAVQAPAHL